ncbi:MAG TPA: SsrA-binding protein SmpB [Anaerolineales bacterium]|nr:SsrA-binding protein SmpB [Anaerolineales bacterium]
MGIKVIATNRKAKHEYFLIDTYEAGLVLKGSEIKSIRAGQISLAQAYVSVDGNEAWLVNSHIAPYNEASSNNHDPVRARKLLLHSSEIRKLSDKVRQKGATVIPLRVYLKDGKAKVEVALAKGKKHYDKRAEIAKRDSQRELDRQYKQRR